MLLVFFLLWIIFSMKLDLETLIFGIAVSLWVYRFLCKYMGYSPETDKKILRRLFRGIMYIATLVWETVKANIKVSRLVFTRYIEIEPQIIFFRTDLKSEAARVALANSITLTPGTITVALNDDQLCVHCLNSHMAEGINDSVFVRQLREFESDEPVSSYSKRLKKNNQDHLDL